MKKDKQEKELNLLEKMKKQESLAKGVKPKRKWFLFGKFFISLGIVLILIGLTFSYKVLLSANSVITSSNITSLLGQLRYLIISPDKMIDGEATDRINILLLGMGGAGHSGGYLADTIIVASVKPSTGQVAFLSIPRDLFVPIPGHSWRKINNAFAFGYLENQKNGGDKLITQVVENITGLDINYFARVDFAGFRKVVDDVNGIDVYVERGFTDYEYPTYNYGYQTVSFKEGPNHFSGEKALQYARSRHGNNNEGSDFARAERQQEIILALKEKVLSLYTLLNPNLINTILNDLADHVRIDLEPWEMIKLYQMVKNTSSDKIINEVIDNTPNGPLHSETTIDGAYILRPNAGPDDFSAIQKIAQNIFSISPAKKEEATIEIQNGTKVAGLAAQVAFLLQPDSSLKIVQIGNAKVKNQEQTTIYDFTKGKKPLILEVLKQKLNADITTTLPVYLYAQDVDEVTYQDLSAPLNTSVAPDNKEVDFLIVLGNDAVKQIESESKLPTNQSR